MKLFGIEVKKIEKDKLTMVDKLTIVETVAKVSNSIIYIEPILRVMILKDINKEEISEDKEVMDVYNEYGLDEKKKILKNITYIEYQDMLRLAEERYKELQMRIDPEAIEYLQKAVNNNGKKS